MSNSEKSCYVCGEDVVNEDDYKTHLSIAHGKNYGNKTTSFSSDMTLEENSEDFEESLITQTTEKPAEDDSYDRDGGHELSSFCNEFDARLKEIQDLVDGKVELGSIIIFFYLTQLLIFLVVATSGIRGSLNLIKVPILSSGDIFHFDHDFMDNFGIIIIT